MTWLRILRLLLQFSASLSEYLNTKQLLEAGEAKAIKEGLEDALQRANKAIGVRNAAGADFDKHEGVPDDNDPNLRD